VRHYAGSVAPGLDPTGCDHFWLVSKPIEETEEGTDRWAVEHGYIAMTRLRLDLTNEAQLERRRLSVAVDAHATA
jgi:5'-nucleotidase